ncbi:MAG: hypothetical protein QM605_16675 [Sphingobium sp.]
MALSPAIIGLVLLSAALQIVGLSLLPLTRGVTQPLPSLGVAVCYLIGLSIMARLIHAGVNLGLLIPLLSVIIPLCTVAVGIVIYGEPSSIAKISALVVACFLVAWSNFL